MKSDNAQLDNARQEKTYDSFASLPHDAMTEIMKLLSPAELSQFCVASSWARRVAQGQLVVSVLRSENLPGNNINHLIHQFGRWKSYQTLILKSLYELAGVRHGSLESEADQSTCRQFLKNCIHNYVLRVAGAHSWHRNLPIGISRTGSVDQRFTFYFNLTISMRCEKGKFVKVNESDVEPGRSSWLPTDLYRKRYGFFDFTIRRNSESPLIVCDFDGNDFHTPNSMISQPLDLTAAVHPDALHHDLYEPIVAKAVTQNDTQLIYNDLESDMFQQIQRNFLHSTSLCLPREAARDLEEIAHQRMDSTGQASTKKALMMQQLRERRSIALSLRELCLKNYGPGVTPTVEEACSFLPM